ncbi:hypothetical protein PL11_003850 [Lentilactobacillus curieae]|uniref:YdhG-like domain-containing protein n=1 Tax=Lentilactobacillus curieae TaxID=1138822 RepID=A0A1S6QHM6_9LACO|nr:DUF1801 domain-containing protein [Lentilactobacillus curieae]AQW21117.1 hypothetical protein PL11_003850 [Lentilactobacillus curieae]
MPKKPSVRNFNEYVSISAPGAQPLLIGLRNQILSETESVSETISWSQPFFVLPDKKISTSAYKDHVSLQTSLDLTDSITSQAKAAGYTTGQKRLNIKFDQELPTQIISEIIKQSANP